MNRRFGLVLFVVFLASACTTGVRADERRPNFVFVIADDHRWDALGVVQREQG